MFLLLHLIQLLLGIIAVSTTGYGQAIPSSNYESFAGCKKGWVLPKRPFLVVTTVSLLNCAETCSRTSGCYSINACRQPDSSMRCILIADFSRNGCAGLEAMSNCRHLQNSQAVAMMAANPCFNGGSYINSACSCVWGFAGTTCERIVRGCREAYVLGVRGMGFYEIQPFGSPISYIVYCNCMWVGTIFAFKRIIPPPPSCQPISYNRTWDEYKKGFGDINCEYFLGLETIYQLNTYEKFQWNIYNLVDGKPFPAASIYLESTVLQSEATDYTIDFVRIFTRSFEHGDDAFDQSQKPRKFCTFDRDCGGCAGKEGGGWWFTTSCSGGAITAAADKMYWPVNGVDKVINETYIQLDHMLYY
ncbi:fibrinogen alpha chain-like [Haliotis cracherodii]|uniref:fibrinogen alpha chain-like n=1 Tax=Haliotis cracherodii TaxID=6455 RepID=UPI0039E77060